MQVGIIGTGAIATLHARVYARIGYQVRACTDVNVDSARRFADAHGAEPLGSYEAVCRHPEIDYVDVCTLPDFRLEPIRAAAAYGKSIQVQKPIAVTLNVAREMIAVTRAAGVRLGVVSQHRFDAAVQFVRQALADGRLGTLVQCDAYVKWHRSAEYYARPVKGSWAAEGGGALINQGIHQVDLLQWLAGGVADVFAWWQLGAVHPIESEDVVSAVLRFRSGATGVIQASTALWPGYPERLEIHGAKGTAIITGDRLTQWDVRDDHGVPPPLSSSVASGASDPMAISLDPFERQFRDFGDAVRTGRDPAVSGEDGYAALAVVDAVYRSCRTGQPIHLSEGL